MIDKYNRILLPIFFFMDLILVGISFYLSFYIRFSESIFYSSHYVTVYIVMLCMWCVIAFFSKNYHEHRGRSLYQQLKTLFISEIIFLLSISLYVILVKGYDYSRSFLFFGFSINFLLIFIAHILRNHIMKLRRKKGGNFKRVLLLGNLPENGNGGTNFFPSETGHKIEGHLTAEEILESLDQSTQILEKEIKSNDYDILLVAAPLEFGKNLHSIVDIAEEYGLHIDFYPHFVKSLSFKIDVHYIDGIPLIRKSEPLKFLHNRIVKRAIDLVVAGLAFILFYWWFYLFVGLAIKLTSKGPVLFKQKRIGTNGEEFLVYKFRTMRQTNNDEYQLTKKNDPRVTNIGKWLRKTNLDELPQIINVLKGEMSIVGPRPHPVEEDLEVRKKVSKYMVRHFVKPGITGWAAINGYRGGTEDMDLMQKRIDHDIYYIEFWTPWLDIKIITKTLWQMATLNNHNAY